MDHVDCISRDGRLSAGPGVGSGLADRCWPSMGAGISGHPALRASSKPLPTPGLRAMSRVPKEKEDVSLHWRLKREERLSATSCGRDAAEEPLRMGSRRVAEAGPSLLSSRCSLKNKCH